MTDRERIEQMIFGPDIVHAEGECDSDECALARAAALVLADLKRQGESNRWAAFTDDELVQISGRVYDALMWNELSKQAEAEIERRRGDA